MSVCNREGATTLTNQIYSDDNRKETRTVLVKNS